MSDFYEQREQRKINFGMKNIRKFNGKIYNVIYCIFPEVITTFHGTTYRFLIVLKYQLFSEA